MSSKYVYWRWIDVRLTFEPKELIVAPIKIKIHIFSAANVQHYWSEKLNRSHMQINHWWFYSNPTALAIAATTTTKKRHSTHAYSLQLVVLLTTAKAATYSSLQIRIHIELWLTQLAQLNQKKKNIHRNAKHFVRLCVAERSRSSYTPTKIKRNNFFFHTHATWPMLMFLSLVVVRRRLFAVVLQRLIAEPSIGMHEHFSMWVSLE